jgi:outer membrane protein assembly factor BamA
MTRFIFTATFFFCCNIALAQNKSVPIQSVTFDDAFESFDSAELQQAAQLLSFYNPVENVEYAKRIEIYLQQQGYLYARITKIKPVFNSDSSFVELTISGNPGSLVLFGDITINSDSLDATRYRNLLSVQKYDPYAQAILESDISHMLSLAADSGFVYARAKILNVSIDNSSGDLLADVDIKINEGEIVEIDKIEISGNNYTRPTIILRELPVKTGQRYSKTNVAKIPQRLMRLGIFKNVKTPSMIVNKDGEYILALNIVEGNATTFDGVVGYIPENKSITSGKKSNGYFTGLVDVSFNNLFGTARRFDIHWEKPDKNSENFFLRYTEPWLLDYPVDVSVGLERTVRDSTYIEWKAQLQNKWRYNEDFSVISSLERQVVLPDSIANRDQRLVRYEQINLEIGLEYDTRDYPVNPRQGIFIGHSYTLGLKHNYGPGYLLQEDSIKSKAQVELIKLRFDWYRELFRNQVLALRLKAYLVDSDRLQLTDLIWFGGARTLRGYRENQFQGNIASWLNLEYRFLLARNSRIFVFNDWGAYQSNLSNQKKEEILYGYGIGLRLDTALGIMAIDFGLGRNDSFSEGKIHFGIINRF